MSELNFLKMYADAAALRIDVLVNRLDCNTALERALHDYLENFLAQFITYTREALAAERPALTVIGLSFAYALTGAVLVEIIFAWPGLGRYVSEAILAKDFPVIAAVTMVVTICYVVMNLLIDTAQALVDPRVALS